jgi:hypothetical protein
MKDGLHPSHLLGIADSARPGPPSTRLAASAGGVYRAIALALGLELAAARADGRRHS